ncbi:hypothetical protein M885DRAFT_617341 [Pelagophyceae sp. CCMP2097]|nr:hypothetical protein M885DRAFT_617341 [Pelagophyceae sp. CCMP2097]
MAARPPMMARRRSQQARSGFSGVDGFGCCQPGRAMPAQPRETVNDPQHGWVPERVTSRRFLDSDHLVRVVDDIVQRRAGEAAARRNLSEFRLFVTPEPEADLEPPRRRKSRSSSLPNLDVEGSDAPPRRRPSRSSFTHVEGLDASDARRRPSRSSFTVDVESSDAPHRHSTDAARPQSAPAAPRLQEAARPRSAPAAQRSAARPGRPDGAAPRLQEAARLRRKRQRRDARQRAMQHAEEPRAASHLARRRSDAGEPAGAVPQRRGSDDAGQNAAADAANAPTEGRTWKKAIREESAFSASQAGQLVKELLLFALGPFLRNSRVAAVD